MPKQNWILRQRKVDFDTLAQELSVSSLVVRLLCNRGMTTKDEMAYYLYGTMEQLHSPYLLADAEKAMKLLVDKIKEKRRIRIIGDYDVDGVTATYIIKKSLLSLGAEVSAVIPDRMKDGYGLNERLIREAARDGIDTLLTCDNGIAAYEEITMAKQAGMTVIVTDHHEVPYREDENGREEILPPADAIVDPKRNGDAYPFREICGAFVAMKCMQILFDLAIEESLLSKEQADEVLLELTEFAAFGTVCDVMPLLDENRILVRTGLALMEHSANLGLRSLMEVNGLMGGRITNYHVGFVLGPCLNATGRLDTAHRGLELFEAKTTREAVNLAMDLKQMNESRKEMTERGTAEAVRQAEEWYGQDKVLVIYLTDCHESIAGIIAGKVREKFCKPCLVVTDAKEGLKGSGRSIEAYHMRDGLQAASDLLTKFGGHKLAAGFSLPKENLELLRSRLNENCTLTQEDFARQIVLDIDLPIRYATMDFVEQLHALEPFGTGNERPLFGRNDLTIRQIRVFGKNRNVAKFLVCSPDGCCMDGVYFGEADRFAADLKESKNGLLIAYYPDCNEYRGEKKVQLVVKYYQIRE